MPARQFQRRIGSPTHLRKEGVWSRCVFFGMPDFGEIAHGFTPARRLGSGYVGGSPYGRASHSSATTGADVAYWPLPATHPLYTLTTDYTVLVLVSPTTLTAYSTLMSVPYRASGWGAPYHALGFTRNNATSGLTANYAQSGALTSANSDTGLIATSDGPTWYGYRRVGADVRFYRDGVPFGADKTITNAAIVWNEKRPFCTLGQSESSTGSGITGYSQLCLVFRGGLTDAEVLDVVNDPYWATREDQFEILASSGGTTITPTNGSLTLLGYAPTLAQAFSITPGAGALTLAGYAASVAQNNIIIPGVGEVSLLGYAPGLVSGTILTPGAGALELAGYAPQIGSAGAITPSEGTLTLVGYQPGVTQQTFIVPGVGTLTLSGLAPSVAGAGTLIPSEASLTLVGYQPLVTQQTFIVPGVGTLSLETHAPLVVQNNYIVPGVGEVTFVGYAPSVGHGTVVTPGVGQLLLEGGVPSVASDSGSLNLTPGAGSLGFLGYAPTALTAVFVDGNGRVFWIPAQATEWIIPARSKRWVLAR